MQSTDQVKIANEESYTQRRMLFKNIWETAMTIDDKDDIMSKPKVIKTLRLDEVDKLVIGKTRKQRIKNLRHVCKKILDFCDRQDADDVFYEQLAKSGQEPHEKLQLDSMLPKKKHKGKKKVKRAGSLFVRSKTPITIMKATVSERKKTKRKSSKVTSPLGRKRSSLIHVKAKVVKSRSPGNKASPAFEVGSTSNEFKGTASVARRKPVKKKYSKKKKISLDSTAQPLSNMINAKTGSIARQASARTKPLQARMTKVLSTTVEIN